MTMKQTYYRESDVDGGAWKVALITREHNDGTRDLLVFGKVGDKPKKVAGAAEYPDAESGWSDTRQVGNGRLELQSEQLRTAVNAGEVELPAEKPELAETEPPAEPETSEPSLDPADFTVEELEDALKTVEDFVDLAAIRIAEIEGKNRVTAVEAIDERARELGEAEDEANRLAAAGDGAGLTEDE